MRSVLKLAQEDSYVVASLQRYLATEFDVFQSHVKDKSSAYDLEYLIGQTSFNFLSAFLLGKRLNFHINMIIYESILNFLFTKITYLKRGIFYEFGIILIVGFFKLSLYSDTVTTIQLWSKLGTNWQNLVLPQPQLIRKIISHFWQTLRRLKYVNSFNIVLKTFQSTKIKL